MLSPLKPLLCRHEFYWSERHKADRCHRCGKTQVARKPDSYGVSDGASILPPAEAQTIEFLDSPPGPKDDSFLDIPARDTMPAADKVPLRNKPSAKVLKAQALERRENLLGLLERIADGGQPSRKDLLDAVLGVIEDAHSADPVLFGPEAADRFARLHEARGGLIF